MRLDEIRNLARAAGLTNIDKLRKTELVRAIQKTEGNPECFATDYRRACAEAGCCWRADCRTPQPGKI